MNFEQKYQERKLADAAQRTCTFNNIVYQQIGVVIGSPFGPVIPDIFMVEGDDYCPMFVWVFETIGKVMYLVKRDMELILFKHKNVLIQNICRHDKLLERYFEDVPRQKRHGIDSFQT